MCEFLFRGNYYYYQQCQGWKIISRKQKWAEDVQPPVPWKLLLPHHHGGPPMLLCQWPLFPPSAPWAVTLNACSPSQVGAWPPRSLPEIPWPPGAPGAAAQGWHWARGPSPPAFAEMTWPAGSIH